jgi:DNA-binding transcriptional regulator YiaG
MHILLTMAQNIDIKFIRKHLNWTRAKLAEQAGVDVSTVSRWENGRIPERGTAKAFLERLARRAELRAAAKASASDMAQAS